MRTRTRKNLEPRDNFKHFPVVKLTEDRPSHDDPSWSENATLESNRTSGKDVVACAHLNHHASLETGSDSIGDSIAQRVFDTNDANKGKVLREVLVRDLKLRENSL